jgi:Fe(3+) dicitrate transport protein
MASLTGSKLALAQQEATARTAPPRNTPTSSAERARAAQLVDNENETAVTVIGRELPRVSGSVSVVSRRDLRLQQPLSVNEAMRRTTGVTVRDEDGMGLRPNISIRGLDGTRSRRVLLMEDGVPISLNPYSEPDAYYMPPVERVERVEVIRGSGAILYGPQTIGGVINLVTPSIPRRPSVSASSTVGYPGYLSVHAMGGLTVGGAGALLSVLRKQGVGFRNQGLEVTELLAKFRLQLGTDHEIQLRGALYDEGSASTYLGLTTPMYLQNPWQNPAIWDWMDMRRYQAAMVHTWRMAPGWRMINTFFAYATHRNWHRQLYDRDDTRVPNLLYERIVGDRNTPGGAIYLRNGNRNNDRAYEVAGVQSRIEAAIRTGSAKHELDLGARVLVERSLRRVFFGSLAQSRTGNLDSEEQGDGLALSLFAQDRVTMFDRFTITPGVRFEHYSFARTTRRLAGVDVFRRGSSSVWTVIPGFSAAHNAGWLTTFGGIHLGYSPPRITVAIDPNTGADRQLDAERSVNGEIGVRIVRGQWLKAETTAFVIDFENEIIPGSYAGGMTRTEYINGGRSRYLGVEGAVMLDIGRALEWGHSVFADVRCTGVDARLLDGPVRDHLVPYAVPFTGTASIGFEHSAGLSAMLTGTIVAQHFSDRENTAVASNDGLSGPIPTYTTLDFAARYTHRHSGLGFTLTVKNLLNQPYIASRLPEGIFPAGFAQALLGVRWERW